MATWSCSMRRPPTRTAPPSSSTRPLTVPYASNSLRNPFPPIADYAFLSDCENSCLISSSGSVEWLCVPRPDSPSVFGAILDRGAGHFRIEPLRRFGARPARRYLPGSLILETTWQTHTGWMIVRDALVMGPVARHRDAVAHASPCADGLGRRAHPAAHRAMCQRHRRAGDGLRARRSTTTATAASWEYSASGYGEAVARATETRTPTRRCG